MHSAHIARAFVNSQARRSFALQQIAHMANAIEKRYWLIKAEPDERLVGRRWWQFTLSCYTTMQICEWR